MPRAPSAIDAHLRPRRICVARTRHAHFSSNLSSRIGAIEGNHRALRGSYEGHDGTFEANASSARHARGRAYRLASKGRSRARPVLGGRAIEAVILRLGVRNTGELE
jgi:hypothetical protein